VAGVRQAAVTNRGCRRLPLAHRWQAFKS
jgi:hypothetical protein